MSPSTRTTFRIGAALALPITLAAGTVALAAWLFASDLHVHRRAPRSAGQVIVLDDLPVPEQTTARKATSDDRG